MVVLSGAYTTRTAVQKDPWDRIASLSEVRGAAKKFRERTEMQKHLDHLFETGSLPRQAIMKGRFKSF